jgi:hypothetical protein
MLCFALKNIVEYDCLECEVIEQFRMNKQYISVERYQDAEATVRVPEN